MAKIKILVAAIGKISGQPLASAAQHYQKRLKTLVVKEIDCRKKLPPLLLQVDESRSLIDATKGCFRIALDVRGKTYDSENFAKTLQQWQQQHDKIAFMIGGADGHNEELLLVADEKLSLGPMIMPHLLARVVLLEQIYRAETIWQNHPYHRG
jgi:23S rRNA (pseudouridine1915-N3)-methyltransferase